MLIPNLRTIEIDDIQLIRFWRNLDHINSRMAIKDVIDFDAQRNWFESLILRKQNTLSIHMKKRHRFSNYF